MAIVIRPLTSRNWEEASRLEVAPEQAGFIETNLFSIAESRFHPELQPMAIYDGGTMVGFLMWGIDKEDGQPWLYRFMIDRRFQRKGYGRAALERLLAILREKDLPELNVGYHRENAVAAKLYRSAGFIEQGIASWGEMTARMELK